MSLTPAERSRDLSKTTDDSQPVEGSLPQSSRAEYLQGVESHSTEPSQNGCDPIHNGHAAEAGGGADEAIERLVLSPASEDDLRELVSDLHLRIFNGEETESNKEFNGLIFNGGLRLLSADESSSGEELLEISISITASAARDETDESESAATPEICLRVKALDAQAVEQRPSPVKVKLDQNLSTTSELPAAFALTGIELELLSIKWD